MSDFFFLRSKIKLKDITLLNTAKNLKSKYVFKKNKLINLQTKNYNYQFILNGIKVNEIYSIKKDILILFKGNVFNLNKSNKNKNSKVNQILDGYLRYGIKFLKKLDGNFTILILDVKRDKIFTVRDRHGSNVLFYYKKKDLLLIFTKIKFINNFIIKFKPNWNLIKIYLFKNYRYSYATTETFFKDVYLFQNNSINFFIKEKIKSSKLFSFDIKNTKIKNINDVKKKFLKLLNKSFQKRDKDLKTSDKAFLLSGGLDSPTIAAIGSKNTKSKIKTYSIAYKKSNEIKEELSYDESTLIKKISKYKNFNSKFVYPNSKKFKKIFDEMLDIHDEPISSPTWYAHYILCKKMYYDKVKYVFGGDGGDHILAGLYDDIPYFLADLKFGKNQKLFRNELNKWIHMHDHPIYKKNKNVFNNYLKKCFNKKKKGKILNYTWDEDLMRNNNQYLSLIKKGNTIKKINKFPSVTKSFLKSKIIQDLHFTSSPPSTRAEIPNFSQFNIECRSVFLDESVVKFCWNLPITLMIKDGYTKWLIRHSLKNYLPAKVLWNKKHIGLNAPANIWFRNDLRKNLENTVANLVKRKELSFINKKKLNYVLKEHFLKKKDHMMFLWKLYSLEKWLDKWNFK